MGILSNACAPEKNPPINRLGSIIVKPGSTHLGAVITVIVKCKNRIQSSDFSKKAVDIIFIHGGEPTRKIHDHTIVTIRRET